MRYISAIILIFLLWQTLPGQEAIEGTITYVTSQHVYVRFNSTGGLSDGDTIYISSGNKQVPVLRILNHSSTSCVCEPLGTRTLKISDTVFAAKSDKNSAAMTTVPAGTAAEKKDSVAVPDQAVRGDSAVAGEKSESRSGPFKQEIHGRLTVASYSDLSNGIPDLRQRMRYTFSLGANHIANTGLSVESYVSFSHSNTSWEEIRSNIFNGLKIYNLSVRYDFSESMYLLAGRRINPKLSSVGAIDGLQFEKRFGSFTTGIIAGTRPDYKYYSINPDLFQYGAYLAHEVRGENGRMQNTLAYIEQKNGAFTDRRFAYFQHNNNLVKNLYFFASAEVDLYKKVQEKKENVFNLYNAYISLRYRIVKPLSIALTYSARNNLIYYETYKDFLDRLLEDETLQGWRFQVNYRPVKYLYLGANAGYRYRKDDPRPTKNIHGYATLTNLPGIRGVLTATTTWMNSNYLDGMIYGIGINRDFASGKLHGGIKYRYVDYFYRTGEMDLVQHVGEINLTWSIYRKLSLGAYYEGTFEKKVDYNRIYLSLNQRF